MSNQSIIEPYEVYQLSDPRDQSPKYIGISRNAQARFKQHLTNKKGLVYSWIQELAALNMRPILTILSLAPNEREARMTEQNIIAQIGKKYELLNSIHNYDAMYKWEEYRAQQTWLKEKFAHLGDRAQEAIRLMEMGYNKAGQQGWDDTYRVIVFAIATLQEMPECNVPLDEIDALKIALKFYGYSDSNEVGNE